MIHSTLVIRVQTYRVTWHSSRLLLFSCSRKEGKSIFYASSVTSHEPRREWLIGNFSRVILHILTLTRAFVSCFSFASLAFFFVGHLSLPRHYSKPVAIKILREISYVENRLHHNENEARGQSDFWSEIFDGHAARAGESHRETLNWQRFNFS